jgi:signal transduction histidine kinase
MSSKIRSMYFSSIAHELRTPLNSILPMVDNLTKYVTHERGLLYIRIVKNSAIHLQNLIQDALDLSRIDNNKFELNFDFFDIRNTINEVREILEFQIKEKHLNFFVRIDNLIPQQIYSDQQRYKQILFNLIGNAIKFTFKGKIEVEVTLCDGNLMTMVKDTGIGIKNED